MYKRKDQVFIILDKMDKIGVDGVAAELMEAGFAKESVDKYMALFDSVSRDAAGVRKLGEIRADVMPAEMCIRDRLCSERL